MLVTASEAPPTIHDFHGFPEERWCQELQKGGSRGATATSSRLF